MCHDDGAWMCRCCGCPDCCPRLTWIFWLGVAALGCRMLWLLAQLELARAAAEGATATCLLLGTVAVQACSSRALAQRAAPSAEVA